MCLTWTVTSLWYWPVPLPCQIPITAAPVDNNKEQEPVHSDPSHDWMFSAKCSMPKVWLQNAELEAGCISFCCCCCFLVSSKFMEEKTNQVQVCCQHLKGNCPLLCPFLDSISSELNACVPPTAHSELGALDTHLAEMWIRGICGSRESALHRFVSVYLILPLWRQQFACYQMRMVC